MAFHRQDNVSLWARRRGAGLRGLAVLALAALLWPAAGRPAPAAETLAGPLPAVVLAVVDGDTLDVRVRIWLGQDVVTRIRLEGIDAPELRGRCDAERRAAGTARAFLSDRLGPEAPVRLRDVRHGKFAGRVLARVETAAGEDLGALLLDAGLVRPYAGGRRAAWCGS